MRSHFTAIALNGAAFLFMCGVGLIVSLLPRHLLESSGSMSDVGLLASCFAVPYLLCQLPVGGLADRFGCKPFLAGGYFLCAASGLLYAAAPDVGLILLGRALQGMGEAPLWALAPALLTLRYPGRGAGMTGLYNASIHIGLMAGGLLGLAPFASRRDAFSLFTVLSALCGILVLTLVRAPRHRESGHRESITRVFPRFVSQWRRWPVVFAGIVLYGAGYGLSLTLIPAWLLQNPEAGATLAGMHFTLFYVMIGLSQLVAGVALDRRGPRGPLIGGCVLAAAGMGAFPHWTGSWVLVPLAFGGLGLGVLGLSALDFLHRNAAGEGTASVSGAFYLCWGLGFFTAPLILGHWPESLDTGFSLLAILLFLETLALIRHGGTGEAAK